jgi:divalent metal cation (Fe/Co/Zn/Cd) transporter
MHLPPVNTEVDADVDNADLVRRGRWLEYASITCTVIEASVALVAAASARSMALLGFGVDSVIEVFSAAVVIWRLHPGEHGHRREQTALRLVGASLLALAVYIVVEGVGSLIGRQAQAAPSWLGIGMAVGSLVVMQWLARSKRRLAAELNSGAMQADSVQSKICSYLAAILLLGLGLNAWLGWWWADPVAALAMVPLIAIEGIEALRGNACGCH